MAFFTQRNFSSRLAHNIRKQTFRRQLFIHGKDVNYQLNVHPRRSLNRCMFIENRPKFLTNRLLNQIHFNGTTVTLGIRFGNLPTLFVGVRFTNGPTLFAGMRFANGPTVFVGVRFASFA
uniref:Uncharacterized protein n=1 Tax=Plectus sambesii TaxID=2011161 RepID=A0A914VP40_9BILA